MTGLEQSFVVQLATMKPISKLMAISLVLVACVVPFSTARSQENGSMDEEYDFNQMYVGVSATMLLPQGGSGMRRLGGGTQRIGYYLSESLAVETDAAWMEDCVGLGIQGLWHCWGYERFDPFLTFGARGWISGDFGPVAGIGAFYHLTDNWSLRGDAQATLGMDGDCKMVYTLGLGVQYTF